MEALGQDPTAAPAPVGEAPIVPDAPGIAEAIVAGPPVIPPLWRDPTEIFMKDMKYAAELGKHLAPKTPTLTEFLTARHYMGPMIQATYGRLLVRANSVWIMILQTRTNWAPKLPPINLAPDVEPNVFINTLLPRVYNTTQEIARLKHALRTQKLTKLTYEAQTAYFEEFDPLCRGLLAIDEYTVDKYEYMLRAMPVSVAAKMRENLMVTDFDTAKELLGRIVAQAVEFPNATPTLNNANMGNTGRGAFTPLTAPDFTPLTAFY
jgi:hypothetical protein